MVFSKSAAQGVRRNSSIRSGLLAVSAATAGLCGSLTAHADITNGFASFAAPNVSQASGSTATSTISPASLGSIGVSSDQGTFTATDGRNYLASSIFNPAPQDITSFEAVFNYQASAGADGGAFVLQSAALGSLTALGADGGAGGYGSSTTPPKAGIANSVAFQMEIYNGNKVSYDVNGSQGAQTTFAGANNPTLGSNDKIQVTLEYFNGTLTANMVDINNGRAFAKIYGGANIASVLGSNLAIVGFTGGTGGVNTTQKFSNFTMVSNPNFSPIGVTGFTDQGIISVAGGTGSVTATMDGGRAKTGDTWYERGYNTYNSSTATSTGLPTSGSLFTSQANNAHTFKMQPYSGNDVVLLNSNTALGTNTGTFTLNTPGAYSALSFLTASGNGPSSFKVTITYADGAAQSTGISVISPDWFNGTPSTWLSNGRATLAQTPGTIPDNINQTPQNPNLYEEDLILPDTTDPIASITMNYTQGGNIMVFALSGVAASNSPIVTYTGASIPGKFDTGTANFSQTSGGTTIAATFNNGDIVIFDDTAVDTAHAINVATVSGGIRVNGLVFNNTSATNPYVFTGAGIGGPGSLSLNGGGTVVLANPNTFSGLTNVNSGLLVLATNGKLASTAVSVSPGAMFNVSGGTLTSTALSLTDSGTVNFGGTSLSLPGGLSGNGVLNLTNTASTSLSIGTTSFAGTLTGPGGPVTFTGGGTFGANLNDGTAAVTTVTVNSNTSTSTLVLTGSNAYTGGTHVKQGALEVATGSYGTGTIYLEGGAFGAYSPLVTVSSLVTGGALILPTGSNILELAGNTNNFTGPVVIQSPATLKVDSAGSIGGLNGANASKGTITVASGGTLLLSESSPTGTLGLTGGVVGGAPITAIISGAGAGNNGALRGPDGGNATWAGNINVSGPATVAAGAATNSATLTLTGAISGNTGSGALSFASNSGDQGFSTIILQPPSATSNTYLGESQVAGDAAVASQLTVQLNSSNGFSPNAGLNFVAGTGPVIVDLNGNNQSVRYLTGGGNTSYNLTNSNSNVPSTLTINNGNTSTGSSIFSTQITGNIAVVKSGPGNQTLNGVNTFTGGTRINAGTLTIPVGTALSNGPVSLAGGTLSLSAPSSISGFGTSSLSGSATFNSSSNSIVQLNPTAGTLGAVYSNSPLTISDSGFTTSFVYNPLPMGAGYTVGGFAFNIVNTPASSFNGNYGNGAPGASWKGIAVVFNAEWDVIGPTGTKGTYTGLAINGNDATAAQTNLYAINPYSGQQGPITVTLAYANNTLTETLVCSQHTSVTGQASPVSVTYTYSGVDIAADLGGAAGGTSSAYVGFTGVNNLGNASSTNYWENQQVSNFNFSGGGNVPVSGVTNNISTIAGTSSTLQIGTSAGSQAQAIGSLTIAATSKLTLTSTSGLAARAVLQPTSLSIASTSGTYTGQLDLVSNGLDIPSSGTDIRTVTAMIAQAYAKGAWTGQGITSSAAGSDSSFLTALGAIVNDSPTSPGTPLYGNGGSLSTTFDGASPADGDILVKYTYYGDANLDGAVDGSDYSLIDNAFANNRTNPGSPLTGWINGDFNYDGVVDGSDYTLMDNAFNAQGTSLGSNPLALLATQTSQVAGAAAVPEPATLSLLAIGSVGLLGRRRRSR